MNFELRIYCTINLKSRGLNNCLKKWAFKNKWNWLKGSSNSSQAVGKSFPVSSFWWQGFLLAFTVAPRQPVAPWVKVAQAQSARLLGWVWLRNLTLLDFLFARITLDNASTALAAVWAAQSHVRRSTSHYIGGGAVSRQGPVLNKHGS